MRNTVKKSLGIIALGISLIGALTGCGGKKSGDSKDPKAALRNEVVTFVNEDLAAITADRDAAVATYNSYFTSGQTDPKAFLDTLNNDAIPKMQTFVDNLTAIETETTEVTELKNLYLQGSQKQLDAMNKVASAIAEENPDYLTEADGYINESKSFFTQYESQLKLISIDCSITINGSFSDETEPAVDGAATTEPAATNPEASGSIEVVE